MDDPFNSVPRGQRRKGQATVQETELRARWFRIKFAFPSTAKVEPTPSPTAATESTEPEFEPPNAFAIPVAGTVKPYPPVERCIYCGATEFSPGSGRKLSEEHIVPEGLGAALILPEASCERCAKATGKIEASVLRTLLWTPRRHLRIRGKKRKRNESTYPVTAIVNGKDVMFYLSLDQHPAMLFLLVFNAPGILVGRPVERSGVQGAWIQELRRDSLNQMPERGFPQFASPVMDAARFCQMLAKIAHGFAVAELGWDGFEWLLPNERTHFSAAWSKRKLVWLLSPSWWRPKRLRAIKRPPCAGLGSVALRRQAISRRGDSAFRKLRSPGLPSGRWEPQPNAARTSSHSSSNSRTPTIKFPLEDRAYPP